MQIQPYLFFEGRCEEAIEFYRRNGFTLISGAEKDALLRRYWSIPARQVETSVVLASPAWT